MVAYQVFGRGDWVDNCQNNYLNQTVLANDVWNHWGSFIWHLPHMWPMFLVLPALYDKQDDFNFTIINFPHLQKNISTALSYGVYILHDDVYISKIKEWQKVKSLITHSGILMMSINNSNFTNWNYLIDLQRIWEFWI